MNYFGLSIPEQKRRKEIVRYVRQLILNEMQVEAADECSIMLSYRGYYLQISFSELHPLMVVCLAKVLRGPVLPNQYQRINNLNLNSVLGSHAVNEEIGCYSYRATHWLDTEINMPLFFVLLDRCVDEAARGYHVLTR